jgi:hypothetical protein
MFLDNCGDGGGEVALTEDAPPFVPAASYDGVVYGGVEV